MFTTTKFEINDLLTHNIPGGLRFVKVVVPTKFRNPPKDKRGKKPDSIYRYIHILSHWINELGTLPQQN
jgi:hypothetical protein